MAAVSGGLGTMELRVLCTQCSPGSLDSEFVNTLTNDWLFVHNTLTNDWLFIYNILTNDWLFVYNTLTNDWLFVWFQDLVSTLRFKHNMNTSIRSLGHCDYILSNRMAVDRKTVSGNLSNHMAVENKIIYTLHIL